MTRQVWLNYTEEYNEWTVIETAAEFVTVAVVVMTVAEILLIIDDTNNSGNSRSLSL